MVSSKAKTVSIVFRAELAVGGRACGMSFGTSGTLSSLDVAVTTERVRLDKRAAAGASAAIPAQIERTPTNSRGYLVRVGICRAAFLDFRP